MRLRLCRGGGAAGVALRLGDAGVGVACALAGGMRLRLRRGGVVGMFVGGIVLLWDMSQRLVDKYASGV